MHIHTNHIGSFFQNTLDFTCLLLWQTSERGLGFVVSEDVRHTMIDRSRRALLPSDFPLKVIQQDMALIWKKGRKWRGAQKLKKRRAG